MKGAWGQRKKEKRDNTESVHLELSDLNQPKSMAFWYSGQFFLKKEKKNLFFFSLEGHSLSLPPPFTHTQFKVYSSYL